MPSLLIQSTLQSQIQAWIFSGFDATDKNAN